MRGIGWGFLVAAVIAPHWLAPPASAWDEIPASDLALTASRVEKGASAEVLLWRVLIDDRYEGGNFSAHREDLIRLKLFDERAVQKFATVAFHYTEGMAIDRIEARTVRPDGSVIPVPPRAFFERPVVRMGRHTVRQRAFAPPGLVPGAIVEYRVHLRTFDRYSHFLPIDLQRGEPVARLELQVHPLSLPEVAMQYRTFNCPSVDFKSQGGGYHLATLTNLPAYRREPLMPPDDQVQSWLLLFYQVGERKSPADFWTDYAREHHAEFMARTKPDRAIREAAAAATAGTSDDLDRLKRLFALSRSRVRNTRVDTTLTDSERRAMKQNRSPGETLASGAGTGAEISRMFAALARASGFDVRYAAVNARTDVALDLKSTIDYFVRNWDVAVRVGDGWVIVDPANPWVPFGMLAWDEEGTATIITGPDQCLVANTLLTDSDGSARKSEADLALDEGGTLEGTIRVTLTGHLAAERREADLDRTPSERIEAWRKELLAGLGTVDVSEPRLESAAPSDSPYVFVSRIRAPGYAQRTGSRLILQPAIFRRQAAPLFPESKRHHPVALNYPWSEVDVVRIRLPEGFESEAMSEVTPIAIQGLGRHEIAVTVDPDRRTLLATRDFHLGKGGRLIVPLQSYGALKDALDTVRERDAQTAVITSVAGR